jgi:hypothetical protein
VTNAYEEPEKKSPPGRHGHRWEDYKKSLKETEYHIIDRLQPTQVMAQ